MVGKLINFGTAGGLMRRGRKKIDFSSKKRANNVIMSGELVL